MRVSAAVICALALLFASCAGAPSRYGCPAAEGLSCRSVSRVWSDVVSGGGAGEDAPVLGNGRERKRRTKGRPRTRVGAFSADPARGQTRKPAGMFPAAPPGAREEPEYVAPRAVRVWIAPRLDADGVLHSARYVYALPERGRWTFGGRTLPAGEDFGAGAGTLRLRGTGDGR